MKKTCYTLLSLLFFFPLLVFAKDPAPGKVCKFSIDLINVKNDKVKVQLWTPVITKASVVYHLPKIVPGTYSEDDFGRYIEEFAAFDIQGKKLKVVRSDINSWTITPANKLYKLSYLVNDTYDDDTTQQNIFEPAGSNIEKDTNYVINNQCFLGYFDGMKEITYEVNISHPAYMYGSTALRDMDKSAMKDKFITASYNSIVDNPVMYARPDTASIKVGNSRVLISIYSPNKKVAAKFMAEKLNTLLQAQAQYLGGVLPVDNYAFLIYLFDKQGYSGGYGALEHSYCSMYYYPEQDQEKIWQTFVDFASHEFFHIITPLTIHSEEIQNFDFNDPKMSKHLWLYEGSTEYHSYMVQEKYGLISRDDLLKGLQRLITNSKTRYNDTVAFTTMSKYVLHEYERQFGNVYIKGALINLCLDIKLLELSKGKYGIMNLIHDLSARYGKQKPFKDDELFDIIEKLTYPEIGRYLKNCVGGPDPLPFREVFNAVGVDYKAETMDSAYSLGGLMPRNNIKLVGARYAITDISKLDTMGRLLGYRTGDELMLLNGKEISFATINKVVTDYYSSVKTGDSVTVTVLRKDSEGVQKQIELKATAFKVPSLKYNSLSFNDAATTEQLNLRNAWLNK
ncbi:MAG: peptidase M61 [Bacteroidota bacterium]